jgi:hypothetical protein
MKKADITDKIAASMPQYVNGSVKEIRYNILSEDIDPKDTGPARRLRVVKCETELSLDTPFGSQECKIYYTSVPLKKGEKVELLYDHMPKETGPDIGLLKVIKTDNLTLELWHDAGY